MRNISLIALLGLPLSACVMPSGINDLIDEYADSISTLGITPAKHFSDESHEDYGLAKISLAGTYEGHPAMPLVHTLSVASEHGEAKIEDSETFDGSLHGDLALLVDGSGSLECLYDCCEGCPTDPDRYRVDAIQMIATTLGECGSDWKMALLQFAIGASDGFSDTEVLVNYTDDVNKIGEAAEGLGSMYDTPLWDSLMETLQAIDSVLQEESSRRKKGLVIFSDGEDTESWHNLDDVVEFAKEVKMPVHVVALGHSSDLMETYSTQAIEDLRTLAEESRGYYTSVADPSELPHVANMIAKSFCGGYAELSVRFTEPSESGDIVKGDIVLLDVITTPYMFRAPE